MRVVSRPLGRSVRAGTVGVLAALAALGSVGLAQTPVADAPSGDGPHPAHIHAGTCGELGDVVAPLSDIADPAEGERSGPATAHPVKIGYTVVDLPLQEIIDGGHAINVHRSAEEIDEYVACGDIGGGVFTDEDGREHLMVGLAELNDSNHTGVAWFRAGGDQTEVLVSLVEPDGMS